jgi:hypothetical protein
VYCWVMWMVAGLMQSDVASFNLGGRLGLVAPVYISFFWSDRESAIRIEVLI